MKNAGSGRPVLCDEETDHYLWHLWEAHQGLDERQRFLTIAEESGLDLHNIWSSLREHIDVDDKQAEVPSH